MIVADRARDAAVGTLVERERARVVERRRALIALDERARLLGPGDRVVELALAGRELGELAEQLDPLGHRIAEPRERRAREAGALGGEVELAGVDGELQQFEP